MKRILLSLFVTALSVSLVTITPTVEAKRLGGGMSSGMKRQTPPPQPAQAVPAKPAAAPGATGAAAAAPAAAAKRSWMGPIAGIAAGLGIAALLSHFGMGGAMANMLTMLLLAAAAFFVIRFLMRRFGPRPAQQVERLATPNGMQFAGAGPSLNSAPAFGSGGSASALSAPQDVAVGGSLPAGFDAPAFERIAKLIFIRMQAANDAGNLDDLRQFATPEMFATFRLELQERKGAAQQTDVVQLNAQVLDFVEEAGNQIVSVRFHGLIREEANSATTTFDEIWHLVKPTDGSREWAIAGIAQNESDSSNAT